MKIFFKTLKYIQTDYILKKHQFSVFILFIPGIYILSFLPNPVIFLKYWSSWWDIINIFSYNFFYGIVLLIVLVIIPDGTAWVIIRRFSNREELINQKIFFSWLLSGIISLSICGTAYLAHKIYEYLVFPVKGPYNALLTYYPNVDDNIIPLFIVFLVIFFIINTLLAGVYLLLNQIIIHKGVTVLILITCLVVDDVSGVQGIKYCFNEGALYFPVQTIVFLACSTLIINTICRMISQNKDYYS